MQDMEVVDNASDENNENTRRRETVQTTWKQSNSRQSSQKSMK